MKLNRKYLLVLIPMILLVILVVVWSLRGDEFRMNIEEAHLLSLETGYTLSMQQLADLKNDQKVILVDVREEDDYRRDHPEGALSIPLRSLLEKQNLQIIEKGNLPVIIYSDDMAKTTAAYSLLSQMAVNNLYILELPGGIIPTDTQGVEIRRYKDEELRFIFEPDTVAFSIGQNPVE